MQLLAYILFAVTALFYTGLVLFTSAKPMVGGDASMGYGLGLVLLSLGFALSSLALTIIVRSKGGFDWVAQESGPRTALVFMFWLSMVLMAFFGTQFKLEWHSEGGYPQILRWLALGYGQLWTPLLWLVVCFLSIHPAWQLIVSVRAFTIPFWIGLGVSVLFTAGLVVGYVRDSVQRAEAAAATQLDDEQRYHQQHLDEIAAHRPEDSILGLLPFTTQYQAEDVRQAALTKIKSHPDWEALLLGLLGNKYAYREVYSFLSSNPVAHPDAFIQPLNQSLAQLSSDIKVDIDGSNNLQNWSFDSYGIANLLQAIDSQFSGQIVTFYPNLIRLQQALNIPPPERFKGIQFTVTGEVDSWLKVHKKEVPIYQ
ncbi:hypothetical protein GCM10028819_26790 [Spirosoma humi]